MLFGRQSNIASRISTLVGLSAVALVASCGVPSSETQSQVDVVNLPQTEAKWQSIGNCWAYSFAGWAESIALNASNGELKLNISESYISYRHYEAFLLGRSSQGATEVETGGWWETARDITLRQGFFLEGDFIPQESEKTFSDAQKKATNYLNASLKNGLLKTDRSPATVRAELDAAFGVKLNELLPNLKRAQNFVFKAATDTTPAVTFESALRSWSSVRWQKNWQAQPSEDQLPAWNGSQTMSQANLLRRVKRALNAGHPVIIDWFVDFNALNEKGEFSGKLLKQKGAGRQGYHSTVIEDYVVEGVNPATGEQFLIGEGEATPEQKALAAEHGNILYFVVKNSWGGLERLDRKSYIRDGVGGYHKLEADYIFAWLKSVNDKGESTGSDTGLTRFVLPNGF
jgi:hypothetical protein